MGYFSYKVCMHECLHMHNNSRPLTFYLILHYVFHCTLPLMPFLFASTFYNWKTIFWITTCNSNSVAPAKSNQCAAYETNFSIIKANHWFFSILCIFYSSSHSLSRGKFVIEHWWWRLIDRHFQSIISLYNSVLIIVACIIYFRKKKNVLLMSHQIVCDKGKREERIELFLHVLISS